MINLRVMGFFTDGYTINVPGLPDVVYSRHPVDRQGLQAVKRWMSTEFKNGNLGSYPTIVHIRPFFIASCALPARDSKGNVFSMKRTHKAAHLRKSLSGRMKKRCWIKSPKSFGDRFSAISDLPFLATALPYHFGPFYLSGSDLNRVFDLFSELIIMEQTIVECYNAVFMFGG